MQLRVGNYLFDANSTWIGRSFVLLLSADNIPYGETHTWNVTGELLGSGQADLATKANALTLALGRQYQDIAFHADGGGVVASMPNGPSLNGVLVRGLNFPRVEGAVYATFVSFEFTVEASYLYGKGPALARVVPILTYTETVSISGGGRRMGLIETLNSAPVKAVVCPATVCRATQRGTATGLGGYPGVPGPLWPEHAVEDFPAIDRTPKRAGPGAYAEFTLNWTWDFAAPVRLNGFPRLV